MTTTATTRQPDQSTPAQPPVPARKVPAVVVGLWRFVRRFSTAWKLARRLPEIERELEAVHGMMGWWDQEPEYNARWEETERAACCGFGSYKTAGWHMWHAARHRPVMTILNVRNIVRSVSSPNT